MDTPPLRYGATPRDRRDPHIPAFGHAGRYAGDRDVGMHVHGGTELIMVTAGECLIFMAGRRYRAEAGTLFVVPAERKHDQRHHRFTRTNYVTFRASPAVFDQSARTIVVGAGSWVAGWIEQACALAESMTEGETAPLIEGLLLSIVTRLGQIESAHGGRATLHPALVRAMETIEANIAAPLSVEKLAQQACVSPGYLMALFRRQAGKGPTQYQQELRMRRAAQLLRAPYLSVQEVGVRCGYDDPNYFARVFRKTHHCSPREFRAQREAMSRG